MYRTARAVLPQDTETDDIAIALAAAAFAFLSVLAGKRWGLDLSAKLFVIAFVLVAFSAQQGQGERRGAWPGWQRGQRRLCICSLLGSSRAAQGGQAGGQAGGRD